MNHSDEHVMNKEEVQQILAQYDKESNTRRVAGVPKTIVRYLCVALTLYVIALNTFFLQPAQIHRASFLGLALVFTFLLYPARKKHAARENFIPWYDVLLMIIAAVCYFYYVFNFRTIVGQMATFTPLDVTMAVIGIIVLFIACYRVIGIPLMIVVAAFLTYAFFGQFIPGQFGHAGFRTQRIVTFLFYSTEGILGTPIMVAASFIFIFILFGAFLEKTGIGAYFIDLANAIAGKATGGPAKVAVISSALQGTISGSSVANTVSTGSFTIPMMKRLGYKPEFAGAVEAAASTGGQIMPPVMGAAAFLMAEITDIPYPRIILAAIIPAILYFSGVLTAVHFEAKKTGLKGMPAEEVPNLFRLLRTKGHLLIAIVSIVFFLSIMGFTITRSALYAIGVAIVLSMFRKDTRLTPTKFVDALEQGARNAIGVSVACAMAGIIVGIVTMTGLGLTFANALVSMADGINHETLRLIAVLFFCMIASLVLGLGVPTTAKYIIMATVVGPILVRLGVPLLAAHMFVFYFGIVADITPPVALAAYAGSAISGGDPMKTGVTASRLAIAAFIVPYIFVLSPQMLWIDATPLRMMQIALTSFIGIVGIAAGFSGYFIRHISLIQRIILIFTGLFLIYPGVLSDVVGMVIVGGFAALQLMQSRRLA